MNLLHQYSNSINQNQENFLSFEEFRVAQEWCVDLDILNFEHQDGGFLINVRLSGKVIFKMS